MSERPTHTAYFDSSALVKRYITETGTAWVQAWCDDPDQTVAVAEIGLVEIAAAFAAKLRSEFITQAAYHSARTDLAIDASNEYVLVLSTARSWMRRLNSLPNIVCADMMLFILPARCASTVL